MKSAAGRGRLARVALLVFFVWLAGRFWHPYHGFTQFLQIDPGMASVMMPALRDTPVFIQPGAGGYDGAYYVQIATSPALRDPALKSAIDDPSYRARRILLGAAAWGLGGGEPLAIARVYAWLNVGLWFGLAALLWAVFPATAWRANVAWAAMLFGAGVLFSVRLALTDLAALLLTAGTVMLVERGRTGAAAGLVGLAGLTRETAVLGLAALWRDGREAIRAPGFTIWKLVLAVGPLLLWLAYVHHTFGTSSAGQRNLTWPLAGWFGRWTELAQARATLGNQQLLLESLLEHIALTVQIAYLLWRRDKDCPWWRVGAAYVVLFVFLGHAVWGGFPNAVSRVLLPLTLAFNVRAVRARARLGWLLVGNLSVFAGVHALWFPPGDLRQLPTHGSWQSQEALNTDSRWFAVEENSKWRWAWCESEGGLIFRSWPPRSTLKLELQMRGVTPRVLVVQHEGREVWRGLIGDRPQWIALPELATTRGRLELELHSETPAVGEGVDNTVRSVSFACFGARLVE